MAKAKTHTAPSVDSIDLQALARELLHGLRRLRDGSTFSASSDAYTIARRAIEAMASDNTDGLPIQRAARVLAGGHPDRPEAIAARRIRDVLTKAGGFFAGFAGDTGRQVVPLVRESLRAIDARLADASDDMIYGALVASAESSRPAAGVIADLLLATGALDTPPSRARGELQRQLDKSLAP